MSHLIDRDEHVPDSFRFGLLRDYFDYLLQTKGMAEDTKRPKSPPLPSWYEVQLKPMKETFMPRDDDRREFLTHVIYGMDLGKPYISTWQHWLCCELGLPTPPPSRGRWSR